MMPDIFTLGKIIGGGFPLAPLGASAEIMQHFDKSVVGSDKWLMQLGTLSGNPVAAAAGLKAMKVLRRKGSYDKLRAIGKSLQDMQSDALIKAGFRRKPAGRHPVVLPTDGVQLRGATIVLKDGDNQNTENEVILCQVLAYLIRRLLTRLLTRTFSF